MFKLPIKSKKKPFISQAYGNTSNNAWYIANGVNIPSHNGVDFITGTEIETYGTPLVCPFPSAKVVKLAFDNPMSTKGNGVTIQTVFENNTYEVVLWHTGEIKVQLFQDIKEGDVICYIGNSGLCRPAPTVNFPYNGSHLHLMVYKNTVLQDPLTFFDQNQWYLGDNSDATHDVEPLKWRWSLLGITDWFMKLIDAFRFWK